MFTFQPSVKAVDGEFNAKVLGLNIPSKRLAGITTTSEQLGTVTVTGTSIVIAMTNISSTYTLDEATDTVVQAVMTLWATVDVKTPGATQMVDVKNIPAPVEVLPVPVPGLAQKSLLSLGPSSTVCAYPVTVDPTASSFQLNGQVKQPMEASVKDANSPTAQFSGSFYVVLPYRECPPPEEVQDKLANAFLITSGNDSQLATSPPDVLASVKTGSVEVAQVNLHGFTFSLDTPQPFIKQAGGPLKAAPGYNFSLVARTTGGEARVKSSIVKVTPRPARGVTFTAAEPGVITLQEGGLLTLRIPNLVLPYVINGSTNGLTFLVDLELKGSLEGKASVRQGMALDIGLIPRAFTLIESDGNRVEVLPTINKSAEPRVLGMSGPPAGVGATPFGLGVSTQAAATKTSAAQCGARKAPQANGTCSCGEGWEAENCMGCSTSAACSAWLGDSAATCHGDMRYSSTSLYKVYTCSLTDALFRNAVTQATLMCNTQGLQLPFEQGVMLGLDKGAVLQSNATPPVPFCRLVARLTGDKDQTLVCTARDCTFTPGSADFMCPSTSCECPNGCPAAIQTLVPMARNRTTILCNADSKTCTIAIDGIPIKIGAQCRIGECVSDKMLGMGQTAGTLNTTTGAEKTSSVDVLPLIAALPILLLVGVAAICLLYIQMNKELFSIGKDTVLTKLAKGGAPVVDQAPCDGELVGAVAPSCKLWSQGSLMSNGDLMPVVFQFQNIVCTVPLELHKEEGLLQRLKNRIFSNPNRDQTKRDDSSDGLDGPFKSVDHLGNKVLLHRVSGMASEGEVMGLLGPSGSGKTTLLSILASSQTSLSESSHVEGLITLGGITSKSRLRKMTAYVPQQDILLPTLTVLECIQYSTQLRLPYDTSLEEMQNRITGVMSELNLVHVANSLVGGTSSIRGLSGGERRRVTIGMELVTAPKLLIMDEPTSGLDSHSSTNLLATCKQVAENGRIVVMSLHQPSPAMVEMLDQVMFLARGFTVYQGPPEALDQFLSQAGQPCPHRTPVAEHMLSLISRSMTLQNLLRREEVEQVEFAVGAGSSGCPEVEHDVPLSGCRGHPFEVERTLAEDMADGKIGIRKTEEGKHVGFQDEVQGEVHRAQPTNFSTRSTWADAPCEPLLTKAKAQFREVAVLFNRAAIDIRRNGSMLKMHTLTAILMGVLVGCVFLQLGFDTAGAQNRAGVIFFCLCLFGFTAITVIDSLNLEKQLVQREVRSHYYGTFSYLVSKLVLDGLLLRVFPALLFCALMYPMVNLSPTSSDVGVFCMGLALYTCVVGAIAVCLTPLSRHSSGTMLLMNVMLLLWVLVGGFLVNPNSIPVWIRWIRYISPLSYAFEAMLSTQLGGESFELSAEGLGSISGVDGEVFVETLGMQVNRAKLDLGVLVGFYCVAALGSFATYAASMLQWQRLWRSLTHRRS